MNDSWIDPTRTPWLQQKSAGARGVVDVTTNPLTHAEDDPFDPWRYWEIFSGTD